MRAPVTPDVPAYESWEGLVRFWEETDWPEGCKVEIIEGTIRVTPPAMNHHACIASRIQGALYPTLPEGWGIHQRQSVAVPSCTSLLTPDVLVLPLSVLVEAATEYYVPATYARLVAEITSPSTAAQDRTEKPVAYARAGIPLYLLIDPHATGEPAIHLYGEPANGTYRLLWSGKFGETVKLPEPFGVAIDTSAFPRP
ncbi:Uma2 family endonuclease [Streptomyces erythrochromogenes]|uniref:Uma2 family endonuclease n=1 Tax=Streptomyces erythrochromogenes TaxID=285574 RepID=UPI00368BECD0